MPFIIRRDAIGYRLAPYVHYDETMFTLESGEMVGKHQGWIAEPENLLAMTTNGKMKTPEELTIPDLENAQVLKFLKKLGLCLDHEWRIRRFMREPFSKIKAVHVAPIIELHKKACEMAKKEPGKVPVVLGWFENSLGMFVGPQPAMVPEVEGGKIYLYKDRMGKHQIVLKFGDWYAIPKEYSPDPPMCTMFLMQYLERTEPANVDSIEELLGKDRFVTPEGLLVGQGSYLTISVDDILGPPPEEIK